MNIGKMALALGSAIGAREAVKAVQNLGSSDILGAIGLERRRSETGDVFTVLGWIGLGAVVGAGAALLFAPSSGAELRSQLSDQLDSAKSRLQTRLNKTVDQLGEQVSSLGNGKNEAFRESRDEFTNPRS